VRMPNLTQALRVRKVLYHLRGLPLPVPMTVPEFVMVLLGSAVALVMLTAHLVASPVELVVIGGLVGVVVYALRQESVDGKTPGQWVVTALRWISSPAVLVGAHPDLERNLPVRVDGFVVPRAADELRRWTPPPGSAGIAGIGPVRGPLIPAGTDEMFRGPGWLRIDQRSRGVPQPAGPERNGHTNNSNHTHPGGQ
jgi:hypothetical protein